MCINERDGFASVIAENMLFKRPCVLDNARLLFREALVSNLELIFWFLCYLKSTFSVYVLFL